MEPTIIRNREELDQLIVTLRRDGWGIRATTERSLHIKTHRDTASWIPTCRR
jgi:hypothetical protein